MVGCGRATWMIASKAWLKLSMIDGARRGAVRLSGPPSGSFGAGGSCTLSGRGPAASCQITYTPAAVGSGKHKLTASYSGDGTHNPSAAQTEVIVKAPLPTSKDQCKNGGWRSFGVFKNQGDCVSFVASHGKNPPG